MVANLGELGQRFNITGRFINRFYTPEQGASSVIAAQDFCNTLLQSEKPLTQGDFNALVHRGIAVIGQDLSERTKRSDVIRGACTSLPLYDDQVRTIRLQTRRERGVQVGRVIVSPDAEDGIIEVLSFPQNHTSARLEGSGRAPLTTHSVLVRSSVVPEMVGYRVIQGHVLGSREVPTETAKQFLQHVFSLHQQQKSEFVPSTQ